MKTKLIRITILSNAWDTDIDNLVHEIAKNPIVIDVEIMD